ncbi:hypothetical protein Rsub_10748 [Raphidocelis subcapitata]|uniref:Uncharacterized protein n=1 Tax=Raphidocelis subcapitata TaxID=307507 RepID=A0A2V0PF59_9CHLO|nr:hypothetical protein Rsub_10748 [Raphidocelis subcapitata]|eukprot:GBF97612.1 hypothetical protein Rsub_10748 [Raphidocelis subcapitata]
MAGAAAAGAAGAAEAAGPVPALPCDAAFRQSPAPRLIKDKARSKPMMGAIKVRETFYINGLFSSLCRRDLCRGHATGAVAGGGLLLFAPVYVRPPELERRSAAARGGGDPSGTSEGRSRRKRRLSSEPQELEV